MEFAIALIVLVVLICGWVFGLRPHILANPDHWESRTVRFIDSWTQTLWRNSKTILVSRLYVIIPALVAAHDYIALNFPNLDLTPIWDKLFADMTSSQRQLIATVIGIATGLIFEWLRHYTTEPLQKE